jgi:hypothetical protein
MNAWAKGWNKRAKWSLAFVVAWAVVDIARFYASQGPVGYYPTIVIFMAISTNWARTYGLWSSFLWLFQCVTRNKSNKRLWNSRASVALVLAIVTDAAVTIHYETELPHTIDWVITWS